ncbi:MAG: DUF5753 domain-containing protein [Natronosporangium sp.]
MNAVEGMWVEWRRAERAGLRSAQESVRSLYEVTGRFRSYSSWVVPGILQTRAYTETMLRAVARRRSVPDDIEAAVAVRMNRQRFLQEGDHRFAFLIEESVLRAGLGGENVMAGQLGRLITVSSLPNVSLGIVPMRPDRQAAWPIEEFWIFDDAQVNVELVSGWLTVTQPREVAMYAQVFAELAEVADYGAAARSRLTSAVEALGTDRRD